MIEDPRVFTVALSRKHFRELPLRFLLVPVIDGPTLCFADHLLAQAECWRAEIIELGGYYRRTRSRAKRVHMAERIRRLHVSRVESAEGYTWPGSQGRYLVGFAPE